MKMWLKAVYDTPRTPEGYRTIRSREKNEMSRCVKEFANLFKDRDNELCSYLLRLSDMLFLNYVDSWGQRTGTFAFDSYSLNYLDAAVDLCTSPLFKKCLKDKPTKIFISHSTEDVEYIKAFVGMLEKLGARQEHLFCSSIAGYNIPLNENIYDFLRKQFEDYNLYVVLMLSRNYYKSPACLNEMGAAWVLKADYQAILLPGFTYKSINGAVDPQKISFKLNDAKERASRLTELKNKVVELLGLAGIDEVIWERHKNEFTETVDKTSAALKNTGKGA